MTIVQLLKPAEVAAALKISTKHLHDLAVAGEIAFINIGTHKRKVMRFHPDDVSAFVESRRVTVPPAFRPFRSADSRLDGSVDFAAMAEKARAERLSQAAKDRKERIAHNGAISRRRLTDPEERAYQNLIDLAVQNDKERAKRRKERREKTK